MKTGASLPFLILLFLGALSAAGAQEWFRSNSLGQPLAPVAEPEAPGLEWALRVERFETREVARLYHNGAERRRWERLREGETVVEEWFYDRNIPREHNFYDLHGRMTEEWVFGPAGQLEEKIRYSYPEDPSVTLWTSREILDSRDTPLGTDSFSYRADGSLKSIRKAAADGTVYYQVFRYSGTGSVREIASSRTKRHKSVRYDEKGRLSAEEISSAEGKSLIRIDYEYSDGVKPVRRREENRETSTVVITDYDPAGRPMSESWYRNSFLAEVKYWEYDNRGRPVRELSVGSGGRFERRMTYEGDSERPDTEVYYSGGGLIRRVLRPEPGLEIEERYYNGEMVLVTWIRDGIREKEEHYRDGVRIY